MNFLNFTLKSGYLIVYKINLLDQIDGQKASPKMNLLVQLPYSLKSPTRVAQAEERRSARRRARARQRHRAGRAAGVGAHRGRGGVHADARRPARERGV